MKMVRSLLITAALLWGAACFSTPDAEAGSCCGGGAAAALVLPKDAQSMIDVSLDLEKYNGYWDQDKNYFPEESGTDMRQYRLNLGYAVRLAKRWQASTVVPYVWNVNKYPNNFTSRVDGLGDSAFSLWYEAFDSPMCRLGWGDLELKDLIPAATLGLSLTVPTGVSPYDGVKSDDITGRGFYRLDGNILLDKTIYPLSVSMLLSYGKYIERPVNRYENTYVAPYRKQLGDRATGTLSFSYQTLFDFRESRNRLTYTVAVSEVWEDAGKIDGKRNSADVPGLEKTSIAGTIAWSTLSRVWTVKTTWSHAIMTSGWGQGTVASDIYSLGVTREFF